MRSVFIILIFSCRLIGYCQTINNGLNFTDTQGLKQGKWTCDEIDTIITPIMSMTVGETDSEIPPGITHSIDTIIYKYLYWTGYYFNNKKDSIWMIYNTIKQRITSLDDKTIIGNLLYVANFKNDTLEGFLKTYYENGALKSEIEFKKGHPAGKINCYFQNGKLNLKGKIIYGEDFFMGIEYASDGYKLRERKFNYKKTISYWTDINDLFIKIKK